MQAFILGAVTALASTGLGLYLAAYLKRKGENFATREDVGLLVEQVRAVTKTTKDIEARILGKVWTRQRTWELKRDIVLRGAGEFGAWFEAFMRLGSAYAADREEIRAGKGGNIEERGRRGERWNQLSREFLGSMWTLGIVCGKGLLESLRKTMELTKMVEYELLKGDPEAMLKHVPEFRMAVKAVLDAFRSEIEMAPLQEAQWEL
jgi:hypothetical protein